MASANNDNVIQPMPSLPPIVRNGAQRYGDGLTQLFTGQNYPPADVAHSANTPPPSGINTWQAGKGSTISSLSMSHAASASVTNRRRQSRANLASDEDEPSPKKALPDFSLRKSEEDSIASGNDSNAWEQEQGRVMHEFTAHSNTDDALDDAAFPAIAMNEMNKWEFLAEGNADDIGDD
jgi:hypothetical protein